MYHFNENFRDTGSKTVEEIERHARIVHILPPRSAKRQREHLPAIAFIVSKSRGFKDLRIVKNQVSTGNEIQDSLVVATQHLETLKQSMHGKNKVVQAAKKRVNELSYMNSLLDSCFKGWHSI